MPSAERGSRVDDGYLRFPLLEEDVTMVYPTQVGTTAESRLPSHPDGYTLDVYARFIHAVVEHLGLPGYICSATPRAVSPSGTP